MCFEVVLCHYWDDVSGDVPFYLKFFSYARLLAVPTFMIMSFYLCKRLFTEPDVRGIFQKRMWRLLYPFWTWGILYFLFFGLVQLISKIDLSVSINDLLWQLTLGSSAALNGPLWYMADLIIITIAYYLIFKLLPKDKSFVCIWIVTIVAIVLQYSGVNAKLFGGFRNEIRWPIGRIAEMIPYATIGYSFSVTDYIDKVRKHRFGAGVLIAFVVTLAQCFGIGGRFAGFGYSGISSIVIATLIFLLAAIIPFEKLPETVKRLIYILSKFTFGIFCVHDGVGRCVNFVLCKLGLPYNTFSECIIIFLICYIVCGLIWLIPCKYAKQLVE